ncbi:peptidoglycan DD-metalloendopeptidase family protein [Marinoscillum sp.]|uniref:peptidoglycan DD-metalloendopeptidase family protein n=1 Tax=Marinoscillum sp. TaxID=2024838 RepID=UPI003BAC0424
MADWMLYLLKVSSFHAVLVLFYLLFLRRLTFYQFNRWFLVGGLLMSFVLPVIQVHNEPVQKANQEFVEMIGPGLIAEPIVMATPLETSSFQVNWYAMTILFYALGVFLLFQRYVTNYLKIRKFKYGYELINRIGAVEVFRTPFAQPFSFFKAVFIPAKVEKAHELDLVMSHELRHVEFGHSYDRMLVDFMIVLLWFNPFIYLLRKCLIEVHEYQVDAAVAVTPQSKIAYQMSLVSLAGGGFSGPVSFFNFSTIKRRIQMMNRNKSNKMSLVSLALLIPTLFGLVVLFSFEMKAPEASMSDVIELPRKVVMTVQAGEKPSILPIRSDGSFRISSSFGMRTDPFSKERKMHHGMDFAGKTGTEIIASADGEVVKVENQPNGYGKYIVVKHDDTYRTKYAQLSEQLVKVGDQVKKGQVIGEMGSSGRSTAPHLHYEVIENGKYVDPKLFIKNYKFSSLSEEMKKSEAIARAQQEQKETIERQAVVAKMSEAERKQFEANQAQLLAKEEQMRAKELALIESQEQNKLNQAQLEQRERQARAQAEQLRKQELQNLKELPEIIEIPPTEEIAEIREEEPAAPIEVEVPVEVEAEVERELPEIVEVQVGHILIDDQEHRLEEIPVQKDKNKSKNKNKSKEKKKDN